MRFLGYVVTGAAVLLAACGGGDQAAETTDAPAADMPAAEAPATGTETAGAAQAITGTIHDVRMIINDQQAYVYDPAEITIKQGDGIKFLMVSGGPHNVAFDGTLLPADVKAQLIANMPNQAAELIGPDVPHRRRRVHDLVRGHRPGHVRVLLHASPRDGHARQGDGHAVSTSSGC